MLLCCPEYCSDENRLLRAIQGVVEDVSDIDSTPCAATVPFDFDIRKDRVPNSVHRRHDDFKDVDELQLPFCGETKLDLHIIISHFEPGRQMFLRLALVFLV